MDQIYKEAVKIGMLCGLTFSTLFTFSNLLLLFLFFPSLSRYTIQIIASIIGGGSLGAAYSILLRNFNISPFSFLQPLVFVVYIMSTALTSGICTWLINLLM